MAPSSTRKTRIVIENGRVVKEIVQSSPACSLDEFIVQMSSKGQHNSPLLPAHCLMYQSMSGTKDTVTTFVLQTPPLVRQVVYGADKFFVSQPYYLFFVPTSSSGAVLDLWVASKKSKVSGRNDPIFQAHMPNAHNHGNGHQCLGSSTRVDGSLPVHLKVEETVMAWFNSAFNNDLGTHLPSGITFSEWQKQSKDNPVWALTEQATFAPHAKETLGNLLEHITKSYANRS